MLSILHAHMYSLRDVYWGGMLIENTKILIHLPFQIEGDAYPPLHGGLAIILLSGKGMMVTSPTLRRRVAISFILKRI